MNSKLTFEIVKPGTEAAGAVLKIQEKYKRFFFVPYSQLEMAIQQNSVLAAFDGSHVAGYVWYVRRGGVVRIRYLAVAPGAANNGVGKAIVREVERQHHNAFSIQLSCRTDYPAWKFWKRIGYRVLRDRPGRAKAGSVLTDFCHDLSPLPLFPEGPDAPSLPMVAIDANIFFDLTNAARPHHEESVGLLADWLSAEFELCVTAAMKEDLGRSPDQEAAEAMLNGWRQVAANPEAMRSINDRLAVLIGVGETPQDRSDRAHLAHAIAENLTAFVTRDEYLLDHADGIYEHFGISVRRPSEFIAEADIVLNQGRYDRHDLTSVGVSVGRTSSLDQIGELAEYRRGHEKERTLRGRLRTWLAHPEQNEVMAVSTTNGADALLVVRNIDCVVELPLLRCANRIAGRRRCRTLMRYLAAFVQRRVSRASVVMVSDDLGTRQDRDALTEAGFIFVGSSAYKVCLPGVWTPAEAQHQVKLLSERAQLPSELTDWFSQQFDALGDASSFLKMEHAIWPGKLKSDGVVESIAIPIRPTWARSLFDPHLGQAEFWQEDTDLLLNPTSAYYTGARLTLQHGRILWYVSHDERFPGSKRIRACSAMTRRVTGPPLELYRRFRHLGVYTFSDVAAIASDRRPDVVALEFTDTELLTGPVSLADTRDVLGDENAVFQWPTPISESAFFDLYAKGQGLS